MDKRLITSYAGSKKHIVSLLPEFDNVFEFYGGSAAIGMNIATKRLVYNEKNYGLFLCHAAWYSNFERFAYCVEEAKSLSIHELYKEFKGLKPKCADSYRNAAIFYLGAHSLYGGLHRTNSDGVCNVKFDKDKFARAKYREPNPPHIEIEFSMTLPEKLKGSRTLVVLDPPYFAPGKTPCYPNHRPNSMRQVCSAWNSLAEYNSCWVLFCSYFVPGLFEPDLSTGTVLQTKRLQTLKPGLLTSDYSEFCWLRPPVE